MTNPFRTDLIDIFIRRGHKGKEIAEEVREIEALLDGQRCVWTWEGDISLYSTSCGDAWPLAKPFTFCPRCGKRISIGEVKDGQ